MNYLPFYGKKLNMVVDYYSSSDTRQANGANTMAATWRYNNQTSKVKVVGGYRQRPAGSVSGYSLSSSNWQGGKKVMIHVNTNIGGVKSTSTGNTAQQNDRRFVALRTGQWPSGTTLHIDIGDSGRVQGAGGNGKQGATKSGTPGRAFPGSSGLGVEYAAFIDNNGFICTSKI